MKGNEDRPGIYFRQWLRKYWIFGVSVNHLKYVTDGVVFPSLASVFSFSSHFSETSLRNLFDISYRHGHRIFHWSLHSRFSSSEGGMALDISHFLGVRSEPPVISTTLDQCGVAESKKWFEHGDSAVLVRGRHADLSSTSTEMDISSGAVGLSIFSLPSIWILAIPSILHPEYFHRYLEIRR